MRIVAFVNCLFHGDHFVELNKMVMEAAEISGWSRQRYLDESC